jgi:hypothetical protein
LAQVDAGAKQRNDTVLHEIAEDPTVVRVQVTGLGGTSFRGDA